jgi:hypothetical protein
MTVGSAASPRPAVADGAGDQDNEEPEPEASSTSDATGGTWVKDQQHAGVPLRRVRAVEGAGRLFSTPSSSTLTRAMTAPPTAPTCGVVGSPRGLPGVDRVLDPAWAAPLEGRKGTVVGELLPAAWGPVGSGLGAVLRVRATGLCAHVLQPAGLSSRAAGWTPQRRRCEPGSTDQQWCARTCLC